MSDDDSDEELKKAITLSLRDQPTSSISPEGAKSTTIIDLVSGDSDDEDDSLDAPQQVIPTKFTSRGETSSKTSTGYNESVKGENDLRDRSSLRASIEPSALDTNSQKSIPDTPSRNGFLSLDRKAMEAERLARAAKVSKEVAGSVTTVESKKRKALAPALTEQDGTSTSLPAPKKPRALPVRDIPQKSQILSHTRHSLNQSNQSANSEFKDELSMKSTVPDHSRIQYPGGVVKRTWVHGFPRTEDDIKIEEVFQKDDLEYAILSAFQVDPDWIQSKLDPRTRVVWVLQAKSEAEKDHWRADADKNYRFCFPSMEGVTNCMHSKLQLLVHPSHLRVVVPSANLTSYDWGETGILENVCFIIDLPRLPLEQQGTQPNTQFGEELLRFTTAMGLDKTMVNSIKKFDFSRTAHLGFVHTIGGSHTGDALTSTGFCGLASTVQRLGLQTESRPQVDILTGSIGSISMQYVNSLMLAVQGMDDIANFEAHTSKSSKSAKSIAADQKLAANIEDRVRIHFPTHDTVAKCKGGLKAGGTICLYPRWYDAATFPRSLMRDSQSTRTGLLSHSKMWFVRPQAATSESPLAWAYVGSANFSESAWGRLVKDKVTKATKLNCKNWECGVIIPAKQREAGVGNERSPGMDVFAGIVPVPISVPGQIYGSRRPWFYDD